ncbi:MAG: class 3 adenylate cyclase [Kiritimatiellia bacterium]|jgi:class 3 adenylate cyclase
MAHLIRRDSEQNEKLPLQAAGSVIGRLPSSDVLIMSREVSRRHARVWSAAGRWQIEDLGSRCGVRVNGEAVSQRQLNDQDRIDIGSVRLVFVQTIPVAAPSLSLSPSPSLSSSVDILSEHSVLQSALLTSMVSETPVRGGLEAVVRAGERLRGCRDSRQVMEAVLLTAEECTQCDRAVLQRMNEDGDVLDSVCRGGEVLPSRTFVARVLEAKVALLAQDVDLDLDLAAAESIMSAGVRSVVCVPLWDGQRVCGLLYLDRRRGRFKPEDVELLVALGYQAASELSRLQAMMDLQNEQERRTTLLRFLPAGIADNVLSGDDELAVQETDVAVLAAELTGVEGWDASVGELLDALVNIAVDVCGGTLVSVSPSGVRVVFGAPSSAGTVEDVRAAATAAMRMVKEGESLRRQRTEWSGLRLKVGVHHDVATVGMLGPERRKEYCAVGAAVEGADAALRASMPGRALVTMATWPALAGEWMGIPRPGIVFADQPGLWLRS